ITEQLRRTSEPSREPLTSSLLSDAVRGLRQQLDPVWGGFGTAPKFPPASVLEFLLRRGELEPATKTLDSMALGGMYDLVGGGFHRYSVDRQWLVPHFEKMLYDQAQLAPAYLEAHRVTGHASFADAARGIFAYVMRDLDDPAGGVHAAEDAGSEGRGGAGRAGGRVRVAGAARSGRRRAVPLRAGGRGVRRWPARRLREPVRGVARTLPRHVRPFVDRARARAGRGRDRALWRRGGGRLL